MVSKRTSTDHFISILELLFDFERFFEIFSILTQICNIEHCSDSRAAFPSCPRLDVICVQILTVGPSSPVHSPEEIEELAECDPDVSTYLLYTHK